MNQEIYNKELYMNKGGWGQIYSCNLIKIILSYIQEQVESVLSKKKKK